MARAFLLFREAVAFVFENHGQAMFRDGSESLFYAGSANSYRSTKEFVNQIGFGQMFPTGRARASGRTRSFRSPAPAAWATFVQVSVGPRYSRPVTTWSSDMKRRKP